MVITNTLMCEHNAIWTGGPSHINQVPSYRNIHTHTHARTHRPTLSTPKHTDAHTHAHAHSPTHLVPTDGIRQIKELGVWKGWQDCTLLLLRGIVGVGLWNTHIQWSLNWMDSTVCPISKCGFTITVSHITAADVSRYVLPWEYIGESLFTGLDYRTGLLDWTTGLPQNGIKCLLQPFSV